jgi:hypothetical protein
MDSAKIICQETREIQDYIITNLKILSLVKINEKFSIYNGHLQIDYSSLKMFKRWFNRDSRESLIIFLNDLIEKINNVFRDPLSEQEYIFSIVNELDKIGCGISNLKITYMYDPVVVVRLDTIHGHLKSLCTWGRSLLIPLNVC